MEGIKKAVKALLVLGILMIVSIAYAEYNRDTHDYNTPDKGTEFGAQDDFVVLGTSGTWFDPDVEIYGFSIFGSTIGVTPKISASTGSVFIGGNLQVNSTAYIEGLEINNVGATSKLKFTDVSEHTGKVLRLDTNGYVEFVSTSSLVEGDNLGNHIATMTLDMAGYDVVNVSTLSVSTITSRSGDSGVVFSTSVFVTSGNVGIGTTNPSAKLEVNAGTGAGTLSNPALRINTPVEDGTNQDAIYLYENGGQATGKQSISWYNGNENYYKARIWTQVGGDFNATTFGIDTADDARNVATRLAIRNGNVGIGTTNPGAKLEVMQINTADGYTLKIGTSPTDYHLVVTTQGNVGIGTTEPKARLHIFGGEFWLFNENQNPRILIGDNGESGQYGYLGWDSLNDYYRIETDGTNGLKIKGNNVSIGNIYPDDPLVVGYGSNELFRIKNSGNVGIGTTSPGAKLHTLANGSDSFSFVASSGTDTGSYNLVVTTQGNVGIGTTNPGAKLEVAGQVKITGGNPANNYVLTSDANGLARWEDPNNLVNGDNLGNHIATMTLDMAGYNIVHIKELSLGEGGSLKISTAPNQFGGEGHGILIATNTEISGQLYVNGVSTFAAGVAFLNASPWRLLRVDGDKKIVDAGMYQQNDENGVPQGITVDASSFTVVSATAVFRGNVEIGDDSNDKLTIASLEVRLSSLSAGQRCDYKDANNNVVVYFRKK